MKTYLIPVLSLAALLQADLLHAQGDGQPPAGVSPATTPAPQTKAARKAAKNAPRLQENEESDEARAVTSAHSSSSISAGNGQNFSWSYARAVDSIAPVIVDFAPLDDKTVRGLQEDLSIMSHLIRQALEQGAGDDQGDDKKGFGMMMSSGGRSVRALYMGDLGACFMIKVGFPVFAQAATEVKKSAEPATDDEWTRAKNEVFGGPPRAVSSSRASAYNAELVQSFQKQLIAALKSATNIRHLKPDQSVIISVFGGAASASEKGNRNLNVTSTAGEDGIMEISSGSPGTVMTLRATKADVDAFAKGRLSEDDFRTKVRIATYNGSGNDVTSINSWIKSKGNVLLKE